MLATAEGKTGHIAPWALLRPFDFAQGRAEAAARRFLDARLKSRCTSEAKAKATTATADPLRMTRLCREGLGFAEFFGEFFAVFEGDDVEAVQDMQVDDEGDEGEGEEDGDHEPGAAESVA